jgi:predicted membrane protein
MYKIIRKICDNNPTMRNAFLIFAVIGLIVCITITFRILYSLLSNPIFFIAALVVGYMVIKKKTRKRKVREDYR